jgi:hypothetical protein
MSVSIPKMKTESRSPAKSLSDIIDQVEQIKVKLESNEEDRHDPVYRGANDLFSPIPSLFRKYRDDDPQIGYVPQTSFVKDFLNVTAQETSSLIRSKFDQYAIAQHYRIPTRLLDWSWSLLQAIYFALEGNDDDKNGKQPIVWVLNPYKLNQTSIRVSEANDDLTKNEFCRIFSSDHPMVEAAIECTKDEFKFISDEYRDGIKVELKGPIAVFPKWNHPRLMAQRCLFTLHPWNCRSIENAQNHEQYLDHILIDRSRKKHIQNEIDVLGVNEGTIYMDLDSVARNIKREYGLEKVLEINYSKLFRK